MGGFGLLKEGRPLLFSRKAPEKPLELLKALISTGRTHASVDVLEDAVWPDAEGDQAASVFDTTLHRLRKILDCDHVLRLNERILCLDRTLARVDAWEFESLCAGFEALAAAREPKHLLDFTRAFKQSYLGEFLPGDRRLPWTVSYREKLRVKWLGVILKLGGMWERHGDWEQAGELYRKGLETDDLVEEFYQGLMRADIETGHRSRGLLAYDRCRRVLDAAWGIMPAEETQDLYRRLKEKP